MQINDEQNTPPQVVEPVVSRWIASFNTHDLETIVSLYLEDAELYDSGMPRPRYGKAEIRRWFSWRFRSTPITYLPQTYEPLDEQGKTTVKWIARGRGPRFFGLDRLSLSFQVNGQSEFTLREGMIYRQQGTYDHLAVLRQLLPPLRWLPAVLLRLIYTIYLWRGRQIYRPMKRRAIV